MIVKDLTRVGRGAEDTIIVDSNYASFCLQPDQGIPLTPWFDDWDDTQLKRLWPILKMLSVIEDVREPIRLMKVVSYNVDFKKAYYECYRITTE